MFLIASMLILSALSGQTALIPRDAEGRLIRDLVQQSAGESFRGTDVPQQTPADTACEDLVNIGELAVPDLLSALDSASGWAKVHAVEVLAKIKDRRAVAGTLKIMLGDREAGVRAVAAQNLGAYGDTSVIPYLLKAAQWKESDLANSAWSSLGELRAMTAIPVLVANLNARVRAIPGGMVRDRTPIKALVQIGQPAVPALTSALHSKNGDIRIGAALALGEMGSSTSMEALRTAYAHTATKAAATLGMLQSNSPNVVPIAARALVVQESCFEAQSFFERCTDPHCLKILESIARNLRSDESYKLNVIPTEAKLMGRLKDRASIPLLLGYLRSGEAEDESLGALDELHAAQAIPLFVKLALKWRSGESGTPEHSANALTHFGSAGAQAVSRALELHPNSSYAVGHALGEFKDPAAGPVMVRLLATQPTSHVRIGALQALGQMKYVPGTAAVLAALRDPVPEVRAAATCSLALFGDSQAINPLVKLTDASGMDLGDEWTALGAKALPALALLMKKNDLNALQAVCALKEPEATRLLIEGLRARDTRFVSQCADALGQRRAIGAIAPLQAAMNSDFIDVRFAAYMALRRISAKT